MGFNFVSYFFPQAALPKVWDALKPGGLILVEGFHIDTARVRPVGGYHNNELFQVLKDYRMLIYEDVEDRQEWGLRMVLPIAWYASLPKRVYLCPRCAPGKKSNMSK